MIRVGQHVKHLRYGVGEVIAIQRGGFFCYVHFGRWLPIWIRHSELTPVNDLDGSPNGQASVASSSTKKLPVQVPLHAAKEHAVDRPDQVTNFPAIASLAGPSQTGLSSAHAVSLAVVSPESPVATHPRKMIEAFRMGIVPYDCLSEFTFGRDRELSVIHKWLSSRSCNTLFLVGQYGSGKTHLLQYLTDSVITRGHASAWVNVDHFESPFHKPKRVFGQIADTFRFPQDDGTRQGGFRELIASARKCGELHDHRYYSLIDDYDDEIIWDWIECRQSCGRPLHWVRNDRGYLKNAYQVLLSLPDYTRAANVYCYLLSGMAHAWHMTSPRSKLFVCFDEAEAIDQRKGMNFLRALVRLAGNEPNLREEPGYRLGLEYSYQSATVPFMYRTFDGLKLLFAVTDRQIIDALQVNVPVMELSLESLSNGVVRDVQTQVCKLYARAYNGDCPQLSDAEIEGTLERFNNRHSDSTRISVKAIVEYLDLVRFNRMPGS